MRGVSIDRNRVVVATGLGFPLVASKLEQPPLPTGSLYRPRLVESFTSNSKQLTLAIAGPGYGKTTALIQWLDTLDCSRAWVSLDSIDDSPPVFWSYVIEAVRRATGVASESAQMLEDEAAPYSYLNQFLAELGDVTETLVLVLDDLHVVQDQDLIAQVSYFIERLPSSIRIAASTRIDPPFPLGRWQASGLLHQLRQSDFEFRHDEVRELVGSRMNHTIDVDDLDGLLELTEGWAVGLQLALLSLEGRSDSHEYIRSALARDRLIADYLVSEVLDRLTAEDRALVLDLAVLEDFDAELAVAVSQQEDAGRRVRSLEARHLFLLPVDETNERFRLHQLFREFLEQELRWRSPDRIPALHLRAALQLESMDDVQGAIRHHLAAGDLGAAYELVARTAWAYLDYGNSVAARTQLDRFPNEFIASDIERMLDHAVVLIASGRPDKAASWVARIDQRAPEITLTDTQYARQVIQRSILEYMRGDLEASELSALHCVDLLDRQPLKGPSLDRLPGVLVRQAIDRNNLIAAKHWMSFVNDSTGDSLILTRVLPGALAAKFALADGALDEAENEARTVIDLCQQQSVGRRIPLEEALNTLAAVLQETGRYGEAEDQVGAAVELGSKLGVTILELEARLLAVALMAVRLGPLAGLTLLDTTRQTFAGRRNGPRIGELLDETECRLRMQSGDLHAAQRLLRDLGPSRERDLLNARALIAAGRFDEVENVIGEPERGSRQQQVEAQILLARSTESTTSTHHLREAARLGVPRGYFQTYKREGHEFLHMIRNNPASPELRELVTRLSPQPDSPERPVFIEPLTDRENELLALLPTHLTYREMANEMCVSINTIKTYQKSVFRKLGATSRSRAVGTARAEGLIPAAR